MCVHTHVRALAVCVFSSFEENKPSPGTCDKLRDLFEYILCIFSPFFSPPSAIGFLALSALNILSSTHGEFDRQCCVYSFQNLI